MEFLPSFVNVTSGVAGRDALGRRARLAGDRAAVVVAEALLVDRDDVAARGDVDGAVHAARLRDGEELLRARDVDPHAADALALLVQHAADDGGPADDGVVVLVGVVGDRQAHRRPEDLPTVGLADGLEGAGRRPADEVAALRRRRGHGRALLQLQAGAARRRPGVDGEQAAEDLDLGGEDVPDLQDVLADLEVPGPQILVALGPAVRPLVEPAVAGERRRAEVLGLLGARGPRHGERRREHHRHQRGQRDGTSWSSHGSPRFRQDWTTPRYEGAVP